MPEGDFQFRMYSGARSGRILTSTKILGAFAAVIFILIILWLIFRAVTFGLLFPREHVVVDTRPLSEEMAIEVTRKALQAGGYDVSRLRPLPHAYGSDVVFEQNNQNEGAVTWVPVSGGLGVYVRMRKEADGIHCRIYNQK